MAHSSRMAALAVALGLFAGMAPAGAADAPQQGSPQPPSIYVVTAKKQPITDTVLASGYIQPVEEVYVQPQVEGLAVDSTDIEIGDRVTKGQVMAVLADDSLKLQLSQLQATKAKAEAALAQGKAQLTEAQANADEAVRVRDRYRTLQSSGTMSTANLDQASASAEAALARVSSAKQAIAVARADVAVAEAQIGDVELRLSRTKVRAPVSGVVSAKNIKVGAIASASGSPLFTIIKNDQLELRGEVSEEDLLKVRPGQKVDVTLAGQRKPLAARVRLADPTVDLDSRLGTVRISFDDPDRIRAGMFANARIIVRSEECRRRADHRGQHVRRQGRRAEGAGRAGGHDAGEDRNHRRRQDRDPERPRRGRPGGRQGRRLRARRRPDQPGAARRGAGRRRRFPCRGNRQLGGG